MLRACSLAVVLAACSSPVADHPAGAPATAPPPRRAAPKTLADYLALDGPAPTAKITYGIAPSQYAELFEPPGTGPFAVAVLVHGGCWSSRLGGITQMRGIAGALVHDGIAVWNVEYRRLDEEGGGYPGTYADMARAVATLAAQAPAHHLDLHRIVAIGHSAGGQLVQWLAGRGRLPATSPLHEADPLPVHEIIGLGSLGDLRGQRERIQQVCGVDVSQLTGGPDAGRPDPFADTSAASLMPNGSHTTLIHGELDDISPPEVGTAYAELARRAGDAVETITLPNASHFDEVAVTSPAWSVILPVIERALHAKP
jgi:acetyl esterase/lipase